MSSQSRSELHSRVASWTQEIASAHEDFDPRRQQHKRARSSTKRTAAQAQSSARAPLQPVTVNAGKRKRPTPASSKPSEPRKRRRPSPLPTTTNLSRQKQNKGRRKMVNEGAGESSGVRRSARERKPTEKAQSADKGWGPQEGERFTSLDPLQDHLPSPLSLGLQHVPRLLPSSSAALSNADDIERPLPSPSRPGSPSKGPGSPKKSDKFLGKAKSDASLTKSDLAHMVPSVNFSGVREVLELVRPLPRSVASLRDRLFDQPGYIPECLKVRSQFPHPTSQFVKEADRVRSTVPLRPSVLHPHQKQRRPSLLPKDLLQSTPRRHLPRERGRICP